MVGWAFQNSGMRWEVRISLELPDSVMGVHIVLYVSILWRYFQDHEQQMMLEPITIKQDLTFKACLVRILEEAYSVITGQTLKFVTIFWINQTEREATCKLESRMRGNCPELFKRCE
jgi:hypothetical protein